MRALMMLGVAARLVGLLSVPASAQAPGFGELHRMFPQNSDCTEALALGDVDGDGDLDLVVGNGCAYPEQSRLYLNEGFGTFLDATPLLPASSDLTQSVALGDVDGDGDLDLVVGNTAYSATGAQSRLYLNGGAAGFADATPQLPASLLHTYALAMGDVDSDGDVDLLLGNSGELDRLYLNDGSGAFWYPLFQFPWLLDSTTAVALGDLDGDGDLDALVGNWGEPNRLRLNNGSGMFANAPSPLPAAVAHTRSLALGDVDGDGDLDALVGNEGNTLLGEQDFLYVNGGSASFTDGTSQLPPDVGFARSVALGDVDGDGDLDALIGNSAGGGCCSLGGQTRLYLNGGLGSFADATSQVPTLIQVTQAVALGDVDGDGDLDALIGNGILNGTGGQERLYLNDGSGGFVDATTSQPEVLESTDAVALGDVDGDGDLDAFVGTGGFPGSQGLYLNQGTGLFADASAQLPPVAATVADTRDAAFGDMDGDGDLDLLIGMTGPCGLSGCLGAPNRLYVNNGSGVFSNAPSQIPALAELTNALALGDLDGDGDLDALIGNLAWNLDPDRLHLNNGAGFFADAPTQLPAFLGDTWDVALGDVDGDGDLDALLARGVGDRLYVNDGAGTFTDATSQLPPIVEPTVAVSLGDLDGDGDLDALLGNAGGASAAELLYLNDGSGTFLAAPSQLPAIAGNSWAVALGDVDGDGDLDALIGRDGQDGLYRNDGAGTFTDATSQLVPTSDLTRALALGDFDGDGDLDAWMGNGGPDRILSNLTRQLAWRGIPRVGKPLRLDLHGPPSGAWLLAVSLGTAAIPLPPLGTLRLDPTGFVFLGAGSLDAMGRSTVDLPVPQSAALVGATLYWQALAGPAFAFTNLESTTFTNL